jgi:hypothetical protein
MPEYPIDKPEGVRDDIKTGIKVCFREVPPDGDDFRYHWEKLQQNLR